MKYGIAMGVAATAAITVGAQAQPVLHSGTSIIGSPDGRAEFCCLQSFDSLAHYQEDGLDVHCVDEQWTTGLCGMGLENYYPNAGVNDLVYITRIDGADFDAIEMDTSDGYFQCTTYVWISAYNNGALVAEFDVDVESGTLLGLSGGGYDEVRIGAYQTGDIRDLHNPLWDNAVALDNVTFGTAGGVLSLAYTGPCPGPSSASITGATPDGVVGLVFASCTGSFVIPSGVCAGTELGLCSTNVRLVNSAAADGSGNVTFSGTAPAVACGGFIQAVDIATCATTNVEQLN